MMSASPDEFPGRILHQACIYDNCEFLADLLNGPERANLNALDAAGRSVVYSAVSNRSIGCLRILLHEGANPNIICERFNGQTPLHQAALDGRVDLVKLLLDHSADFLKRENSGKLPLDFAREMRHDSCANLLKDAQDTLDGELSQNVVMRRRTARPREVAGRRVAIRCPSKIYRLDAVEQASCQLKSELEKVGECDTSKCDELAAILDEDKVKAIVNTPLKLERVSLLYRSCILQRADLVKWLLDHGATDYYDTTYQQTPLHAAYRNDCVNIVNLLLERYPNLIKIVTNSSVGQLHCLHLACQGSLTLLKALMERDYDDELLEYHCTHDRKHCYRSAFDLNVMSFTQWSPLYFATASNKPEIVKYLLEYETNGHPLSSSFGDLSESDIPQALANIDEYIDSDLPQRLIRPVNVNQPAVDSTAPLHHAVGRSYLEVAKLLIQYGADMNLVCHYQEGGVVDPQKYTPLKFAVKLRDKDMISLLLTSGVRDDNSEVLGICFLESNKDLIRFLLKHKAHHDVQHKMLVAASRKSHTDEVDGPVTDKAVTINWHGINLSGHIDDDWIYESSHFLNPKLDRRSSVDTITSLDVSNTGIRTLPPLVFTLRHLVTLNARSNRLKDLPDAERWDLPNLKEVCLDENCFSQVPEGLFQLPCLERLSVCKNNIAVVSFALWTAPKLVDVALAHNSIDRVASSPSGESAGSIRRRAKSNHDLFVIDTIDGEPGEKREEKAASQVSLRKTKVVNYWAQTLEVVDVLESRANPNATLTSINLSYNKLVQVPAGLPCLAPTLQRLDLSHNAIEQMGSATLYPVSLHTLNLSNNRMRRMTDNEDFDDVISLNKQSVKFCHSPSKEHKRRESNSSADVNAPRNRSSSSSISSLVSLSSQLCRHRAVRFENLSNLNLSHNHLTSVQFSTAATLDQAESESIASDRNRSVADAGLLLPKLAQLDLSHNEIREIPATISDQSELSQLNLKCNLIRELPPEMGLLKSLWNMELSGCPLEGPLADKVETKARTSDIIGFLNSVLKDAKPYASMKLMIVGQSNIGKTTLLSELRKEDKSNSIFNRHFNHRVSNAPVPTDGKLCDLSTVGVDIGDLTLHDRRSNKGKVVFKTWDFGGQEEYYATHQYFLSKRSLYLVLYKLTDGEEALDNMKQWLVNIQTRSPGAHVIIVGSHYDLLRKSKGWENKLAHIRDLIRCRYMVREPAMAGLPNVIDIIEVSARSRYNIAELATMIYKSAWSLKAPGSSTMALLDQRIPAIYIKLEEVVGQLTAERLAAKKNPVLNTQEYRTMVSERIKFRDIDELNQATQFLHDNGVLLHYQDVALSDLYFLDPQWLCDMLAHVITIKPINGFVKSGIMKREHLHQLFGKSAKFQSENLQTYIISLLSKFELALVWDQENLLLPSLLPTEDERHLHDTVKVPMCKSTTIKRRTTINSLRLRRKVRITRVDSVGEHITEEGNSTFYVENDTPSAFHSSLQNSAEIPTLDNSYAAPVDSPRSQSPGVTAQITSRTHESIKRVYLLSYIPSGFWPRLISRIYTDQTISILAEFLFDVPTAYADVMQTDTSKSWQCWKTGLALQYNTSDLLKVKQIHKNLSDGSLPYYGTEELVIMGDDIKPLNVSSMNVLEVEIPDNIVEISNPDNVDQVDSYNTRKDVRAKLLAKVVDHIETLLEDWYPDLGERFQQTTKGDYLVRRLVVCPSCLERWHTESSRRTTSLGASDQHDGGRLRSGSSKKKARRKTIACYSVEELLIKLYHQKSVAKCKEDHILDVARYAPDLVFGDIYTTLTLDEVGIGKALGKGAFGVVFVGHLKRESYAKRNVVAVKTLQPHDPGEDASESLRRHCEQDARKWKDDLSGRLVFSSYCNARQEINILNLIQHPNIVSLVGVLLYPLSLVLDLAPCGSLQDTIDDYSRDGLKIPFTSIQQAVLQTAEALSYLHNESKLIYRDLKAENVLLWSMPSLRRKQANDTVEVRLADFGVSRAGRTAKGEWGTPGYMAPEIIEFRGKEQYTEKVDCYSFGSFLYELMTLKRPFHNADGNINSYVLAGKRPAISSKELMFPVDMLDLMARCWSQDANDRPTADEIKAIAAHPHFSCLQEAVKSDMSVDCVTSSCLVDKNVPIDMSASFLDVSFDSRSGAGYDMYVAGGVYSRSVWHGKVDKVVYGSGGQYQSTETCDLPQGCQQIIHCCAVNTGCWLADSQGDVYVLGPKADGGMAEVRTVHVASPLAAGRIKQLLYVEEAGRVFCLLHRGALIEYHSETLEKMSERSIRTRYANCMIHVDNCLWIGQRDAYITVLPILELLPDCESVSDWMSSDLSHMHVINHFNPTEQMVDTAFLVTDEDKSNVWSTVYPGSYIYRWDAKARTRHSECDLIEQISAHEHPGSSSPPSAQLSSLSYHCGQLLAGTTSGYVVLLDALSLSPLMCLKPHIEARYRTLYSVLPLPGSKKFLTVGVGYRSARPADEVVNGSTADRTSPRPAVHILSWYSNPSDSL